MRYALSERENEREIEITLYYGVAVVAVVVVGCIDGPEKKALIVLLQWLRLW